MNQNIIKIGLFGFGRIGRNIFRLGLDNPKIKFQAISELGDAEAMHYLLMRDSIHGPLNKKVTLEKKNLKYENNSVRLLKGGLPGTVPWDAFDVDIVIDTTGAYRKKAELEPHIESGAKRVIVCKPSIDNVDRMVIRGINDDQIRKNDKIISTTSATTQGLALMLKILDENFDIENGMMTTIHAYTSDQPLADTVRSDLRRSRSAVENIIPNETWAPNYVMKLLPQFKDKLTGMAMNVPIANGSCIDLTTEMKSLPSVEEVNSAFEKASNEDLKGLIGYTDDPIVSSDAIGSGETIVFDSKATMVSSDKFLKTISWFDNGWGFSNRVLELVDAYASLDKN